MRMCGLSLCTTHKSTKHFEIYNRFLEKKLLTVFILDFFACNSYVFVLLWEIIIFNPESICHSIRKTINFQQASMKKSK